MARLPGTQRPHPLAGKLLLALAGCVAGLVLAEIALRVAGVAPRVGFFQKEQFQLSRNIRIGWEPIPNPAATGGTLDPRWSPQERNSLGFRDYEHPVEKVPGRYRILIIGDSVTKGLGIPDPRMAFPMVLESRLKELGVAGEVLNFGVEGYNTQQEVETLNDKGLRYAPDLVILAYCLNDRTWPAHHLYMDLLEQESHSGLASGVRLPALLRRSALYLFMRYRVLDDWLLQRKMTEARIKELFDLVQRDTVEEYFGVLADLSRRHGFKVLVAVFPYIDDLKNYKYADQDRWVQDLSSRHGFYHLDLLYAFTDCETRAGQTIAFDEVHPNNIGHVCAGRALAGFIRDGIAPAQSD
jgi:lysophospholipase L1-like esterase